MWGLVLSVLTIGVSMVSKTHDKNNSTSAVRSSSRLSGSTSLVRDNRLFLSGAVLGVGISLLYSVLTSYFRIHERFRLAWYSVAKQTSITGNNTKKKDSEEWDKSAPILEAANYLSQSKDGSVRLIVTPETAMTSTLNVSLLTLHPGSEISSTKALALEFYYVIDGEGSFSQQGVAETAELKPGDCFVVHPGNFRWISNNRDSIGGNINDLILLRATDGGIQYNRQQRLDVIQMDASYKRRNTLDRLRDGLQSAQDFAKEYLNTGTNEK